MVLGRLGDDEGLYKPCVIVTSHLLSVKDEHGGEDSTLPRDWKYRWCAPRLMFRFLNVGPRRGIRGGYNSKFGELSRQVRLRSIHFTPCIY